MKKPVADRTPPSPESLTVSVSRALEILDLMGRHGGELGVSAIAQDLNLCKSTAHRLLSTLEQRGYVEKNPRTRRYRLGLRLFELGHVVMQQMELRAEARPYLEELTQISGEVVHLGILDQGEVVYIDKVESLHTITMFSRVGRRAPVHCTGLGKALLAFQPAQEQDRIILARGLRRFTENTVTDPDTLRRNLELIRTQGYAIDNEEHESGIRCIAVPIRDHTGQVVAAVSISAPAMRFDWNKVEAVKPEIIRVGKAISRRLGFLEGGSQYSAQTKTEAGGNQDER